MPVCPRLYASATCTCPDHQIVPITATGAAMFQGDGVWLPRTAFQGAAWVTSLHKELFAEYSAWSFTFLEVAATAGAAKGFTEVIGFFHWKANNTGGDGAPVLLDSIRIAESSDQSWQHKGQSLLLDSACRQQQEPVTAAGWAARAANAVH